MNGVGDSAGSDLIVALDFAEVAAADRVVRALPAGGCRLKVGKELFVRGGPAMVARWVDAGWDVFLDLKFHDIPNTVAGACRAAADLGVWMINVHALGGPAMLAAARDAIATADHRPLLTAVTVLTSQNESGLKQLGIDAPLEAIVQRLARLADDSGLDGVVCSAQEARGVRAACSPTFRLVTPGIRPAGSVAADQTRVVTPAAAFAAGATDLVIGRPITRAHDPAAALAAIVQQIETAAGAQAD